MHAIPACAMNPSSTMWLGQSQDNQIVSYSCAKVRSVLLCFPIGQWRPCLLSCSRHIHGQAFCVSAYSLCARLLTRHWLTATSSTLYPMYFLMSWASKCTGSPVAG